jgi:hypothetical protein
MVRPALWLGTYVRGMMEMAMTLVLTVMERGIDLSSRYSAGLAQRFRITQKQGYD